MKQCPYCGYANYDRSTECRKCQASFAQQTTGTTAYKTLRFGPQKARAFRHKVLGFFILGLMIKVYWGGIGPWRAIDNPTLAGLRAWLEPLLLYGGALLYLVGWLLRWI